jgi:hypothetical protein
VELLIATVHRIGARAESPSHRVTEELINAFKRVSGKENILFSIAEAALGKPDDAVRAVVFPAATGGEARAGSRVQDQRPGVLAHRADHVEGLPASAALRRSETRHDCRAQHRNDGAVQLHRGPVRGSTYGDQPRAEAGAAAGPGCQGGRAAFVVTPKLTVISLR